MLQAQKLTKHIGGRTLFRELSWQLHPGDRIGLVGPNGAGKTTLLRILNGEEPADGGLVTVPQGATLGFLPQEAPRTAAGTVLERVLEGARAIRAVQARLEAVEAALTAAGPDEAMALAGEYAELSEQLSLQGGHSLEARAKEVLAGLGFAQSALVTPLPRLSGGWWMRVELARILLQAPTYLFLDEPTNHLDLGTLRWLESFLAGYRGAWVVVSHDRTFLNRTVDGIAELSADGLWTFPGTYDAYVAAREELDAQLAQKAAAAARRTAEIERFVARFRYSATKARQVQSRVKRLAREGGPPPPRAKPRKLAFALPQPPRSGEVVLTLAGVSKRFGARTVYDDLSLTVRRGDKLVLLGDNGAGKSTLLKLVAGTLAPDAGRVVLGHHVEPFYFAQHQLDTLRPERTVLAEMEAAMPLASTGAVRGLLGAFLFGADAIERQVGVLSGGEKSRLALAKMLARPTNLLLLDEPTNHLDLASRDMLERALAAYTGTVIFISHDRTFINALATRVMAIAPGGRAVLYDGDFDYYEWKLEQEQASPSGAGSAPAAGAASSGGASPAGRAGAGSRRQQDRTAAAQARRVARLEEEVAAGEARLAAIDALLCDPLVYADVGQTRALLGERESLAESVAAATAAWEAAQA